MKRKELITYLDKIWKPLRPSFKAYVATGEAEALHRFRVQVKKVKAFVQLIEGVVHPQRLSPILKPVRKIFRKSGLIRDAQIQLQLGVQQKAGKEFKEQQRRIITEGTAAMRAKEKKYLRRIAKSHHKLKRSLKSVHNKSVGKYYRSQLGKIEVALAHPDASWHTCRKHIKTLVYDYKWAAKILKTPVNKKYLQALEKAIGDWHDNWQASHLFPALKAEDEKHRDKVRKIARHFYRRARAIS